MLAVYAVLYAIAVALFAASAFKVEETRVNFQGLGLVFFTLVPFIQTLRGL